MAENNFGKGIKITSGFDLSAKLPLDNRYIVETLEERDAHVTNNRAYEGMSVYVLDEKKVYIYNGTEWTEQGGISDEQLEQLTIAYQHSQSKHVTIEDLHTHDNKSVLDNITQEKVASWDNKSEFDGNYNNLTNKPTIPSIDGLASETYVNTKISDVVNSAPETLNTLNELAKALGNDENFSTTIATQIGTKVDKVNGKSLIDDTEIERLKNVDNYDDTEIFNSLSSITDGVNDLEKIESSEIEPTNEKVSLWINTSEEISTDIITRINDETVASDTTWSSEKINASIISSSSNNVDLSAYALKTDIPTKTSELTNDSEFITEIPTEYITETELNNKGYLTEHQDISHLATKKELFSKDYNDLTNKPIIPSIDGLATKIYVNEEIKKIDVTSQLGDYAKKSDIPTVPTNISAFTNDKGYLTSVPGEYVTETELNSKGYLTEHQDLSNYATKSELHSHDNKTVLDSITSSKVIEWNNKSTFSGSYNDLINKPTIPTKTSELTNDSKFITTIPSEYITETELNNKGYLTEHQDISGKADKTELHNHSNKSVLDGITASKVSSWDNKSNFDGNYNSLTNKPNIPSIEGLATEDYVDDKVAEISDNIPGVSVSPNEPTDNSCIWIDTDEEEYIDIPDLNELKIVTPQMFGAKADGVTDDSEAIKQAIASLPKDGGTLYFPPGIYIHGDGVTTGYSYQVDPKYEEGHAYYPAALMQNKGVDDKIGRDIKFDFDGYTNLTIKGYGAILQSHENNGECSNNRFFTFKHCAYLL
jgi:hypothetical protein